jgi:hypothetical protein
LAVADLQDRDSLVQAAALDLQVALDSQAVLGLSVLEVQTVLQSFKAIQVVEDEMVDFLE